LRRLGVARELVHRAAVALHRHHRAINQIGHDLPQAFRTDGCRDVHRVHDVGEQHGDLLVLSRLGGGLYEWRTAFATELGRRTGRRAAGITGEPRLGQPTDTIPAGVHVNIVSLLVTDVRHITVPSPRRSFETLICRHLRDSVQFCSGLVDLVVCVRRHGGGGHGLALAGERFVGLVAEDLA
jgi:hypothetical protein